MNAVTTAIRPRWINGAIPEEVSSSEEWGMVLDFFLIRSPCDYQSFRKRSINSIWGDSPWMIERHLKRQLNLAITGSKQCPVIKVESRSKLPEPLSTHDLLDDFYRRPDRQIAVVVKAPNQGNSNVYMSFFYHMRNALAHGRFGLLKNETDEYTFAFEDGKQTGNHTSFSLSARGLISLRSLVRIRNVIVEGPDQIPDIETQIIDAIKNGCDTKKDIRKQLGLSDPDWRTYSGVLKKEGKIGVSKQKWYIRQP